jgi:hypothetical protein
VATSLKDFSRRIGLVVTRFEQNVEKTVRATVIAVDTHLVLSMPVDKGRARASTIVSVGAPRYEVVEPTEQ